MAARVVMREREAVERDEIRRNGADDQRAGKDDEANGRTGFHFRDCYYESDTDVIARLANYIQVVAGTLGGPGLALLAFADSSFISLPEIADLLLVVQVVKDPSFWWYYGALATAGSVAGSVVL